jgi:hypothetical protein
MTSNPSKFWTVKSKYYADGQIDLFKSYGNHGTKKATWELEEEMRTSYPHLFRDLGTSNSGTKFF